MYDQLNQQLDLAKVAQAKAGVDAYEVPEQEKFFDSLREQLTVVAAHFHTQSIEAIRAWRGLQSQAAQEAPKPKTPAATVQPSGPSTTGQPGHISTIRVVTAARQAWQVRCIVYHAQGFGSSYLHSMRCSTRQHCSTFCSSTTAS